MASYLLNEKKKFCGEAEFVIILPQERGDKTSVNNTEGGLKGFDARPFVTRSYMEL